MVTAFKAAEREQEETGIASAITRPALENVDDVEPDGNSMQSDKCDAEIAHRFWF